MKKLRSRQFRSLSRAGFQVPSLGAHAYEGGGTGGGRYREWTPTDHGPNTALEASLGTLRSRSRQQVRDNGIATSAADQFCINVVGTGIRPKLLVGDEETQRRIQELWDFSVSELDADGRCDFYGLQDLVAREMFEAGEILVRRRPRRMSDGLLVPLQIQLIEPDHLDATYNRPLGGGREIRQGIELDSLGNRRAYHLFRRHPGEYWQAGLERTAVPADQIAHVFRMLRAGQLRGVPHLHSSLTKLYNLDQYQDAELERKKQAAMKVGWIKSDMGDGGFDTTELAQLFDIEDDDASQLLDARDDFYRAMGRLRPGTWNVLMPGDDIEYNDPTDVGGNYATHLKELKHEIAAQARVTYEQLTGDMSDTNYSSARVRLIDIRRGFEMVQRNELGFQFCRMVWRWWIEAAVASGALRIPDWNENRHRYLNPIWVPQAFEHVDPVKDTTADILEVRAGFASRRQKQAERGNDPDVTDSEIERGNKAADRRGFVFDTDPRKTAKSGTVQDAEAAAIDDAIRDGERRRETEESEESEES